MLLLLLLRTPDMPTNANDWITIYLGYIQITTKCLNQLTSIHNSMIRLGVYGMVNDPHKRSYSPPSCDPNVQESGPRFLRSG